MGRNRLHDDHDLHQLQVLENIARLGALTGHKKAAAERVAEILRVREAAFKKTAHQTPESVIVVLQRDPVFLVGGGNFIEEILTDLHVKNPASSFEESYPRVAREWVIACLLYTSDAADE